MSVLLVFVFSLIPALIAGSKGRNAVGYYILSLIISPLIVTIIVLCLKNLDDPRVTRTYDNSRNNENDAVNTTLASDSVNSSATCGNSCEYCGSKLVEGDEYCSNCGAKVIANVRE